MLQFLCLALMMAYVSAQTPYTSCHNPDPLTFLQMDTCNGYCNPDIGGATCPYTCAEGISTVTPGDRIYTKLKFIAPFYTKALSTSTNFTVGEDNLVIFYSIECGDMDSAQMTDDCPIVSGEEYTIEYDVEVTSWTASKGTGEMTVTLMGDNDQVISCAIVMIQVV